MKKPDRFERIVNRYRSVPMNVYEHINLVMTDTEAIKLLRREHAWVMRMIQQKQAESWSMPAPDAYVNGYQLATSEILEKLKQRKR